MLLSRDCQRLKNTRWYSGKILLLVNVVYSLMKRALFVSIALTALFSCSEKKAIVDLGFVDSLLLHYSPSSAESTMQQDLLFWEKRVDSLPFDLVNSQKYAQALASRFHFLGDIHDLRKADSIYHSLNSFYKGKDAGSLLTLASFDMLQHRFGTAKLYVDSVAGMKAEPYATQMMLFDADFELGNYPEASSILRRNFAPHDYAYNFRLSKQDHVSGTLDSAISHMLKAAGIARSPYLKQAALSNAADLYIHAGALDSAYRLYKECIRINSSDFHSITGLGWIALVHDGNDSLAKKIFSFVHQKLRSPDPIWRLVQANELNDSNAAKAYAAEFVSKASAPEYGSMYNKYLVDLYTGILNQPAKAVSIARKEITNRTTPQTWVWLAWSLAANGDTKEAYEVFEEHVSGQPLEGVELFWMGKMMKKLGKGYNAKQFFEAAEKNKYDLSPKQRKELAE